MVQARWACRVTQAHPLLRPAHELLSASQADMPHPQPNQGMLLRSCVAVSPFRKHHEGHAMILHSLAEGLNLLTAHTTQHSSSNTPQQQQHKLSVLATCHATTKPLPQPHRQGWHSTTSPVCAMRCAVQLCSYDVTCTRQARGPCQAVDSRVPLLLTIHDQVGAIVVRAEAC